MTKECQRGFSLMELMIAVAVLGVLAALAGPVMDLIEKRRLASAAEEVYGRLQLARSEAIRQGSNMYVSFRNEGDGSWCLGLSGYPDPDDPSDLTASVAACDCRNGTSCMVPLGGTNTLQVIRSADYANISTATGTLTSPMTLNFVRGSVTGGDFEDGEQSFVFNSPKNLELQIRINVLGRVRICSPGGAGNVVGYKSC